MPECVQLIFLAGAFPSPQKVDVDGSAPWDRRPLWCVLLGDSRKRAGGDGVLCAGKKEESGQ